MDNNKKVFNLAALIKEMNSYLHMESWRWWWQITYGRCRQYDG